MHALLSPELTDGSYLTQKKSASAFLGSLGPSWSGPSSSYESHLFPFSSLFPTLQPYWPLHISHTQQLWSLFSRHVLTLLPLPGIPFPRYPLARSLISFRSLLKYHSSWLPLLRTVTVHSLSSFTALFSLEHSLLSNKLFLLLIWFVIYLSY